jgi:predicted esterase
LKSWPNAFARGCGASKAALALVLAAACCPAAQSAKAPLLVLLGGETSLWQSDCRQRGWQFLEPWSQLTEKDINLRVQALAAKVAEAKKQLGIDDQRVYLAGQGEATPAVFYVAAHLPDLWAAAVAVGGSPRAAIDSNRLFAANTTNLPVLWLFANKGDEPIARKLKFAGFNLETREEPAAKPAAIFNWLAGHFRDPFPATADCETATTLFPHCYWVEMTRFDPMERNDVLDSTRVPPLGSGAGLQIGPFGFDPSAPGPGVLVTWLPQKYSGPLKLHDRIIELRGKPLKDGAQYARIMNQTTDEQPVVVMVQRGKHHIRLETYIVLPKREALTARVQARFLPDLQEVQVISRSVTQMKLTLPPAWLPARINWNGTVAAQAEAPGCWLLEEKKELVTAKPCQGAETHPRLPESN